MTHSDRRLSQVGRSSVLHTMQRNAYLLHRASKRPRPSRSELRLIDRDLADAGVHIPWTTPVSRDDRASRIALRVIQDVLDAA